jgi:hypothetical protein
LSHYIANQKLQKKNVVTIMSGFRNTSLLLANQGQAGVRKTSMLGYYTFLQMIDGGYDPSDLIVPVIEFKTTADPKVLGHLLKSTKNPQRELDRLIKAIEVAHIQFMNDLKNWIKGNMPNQVDAIIGCGGTFDYIGTDLNSFLTTKIKDGDKNLYMCQGYETNYLKVNSRFADIWHIWHVLHRQHQAQNKELN